MAELLATPLNSTDLSRVLGVHYKMRRPAFVWGPPGIGKSRLYKAVAKKLGLRLKDVRALLMNPVDVNGLPHVQFRTRAMAEFQRLVDTDQASPDKIAQIFSQTSEVDLYGTTLWSRPGFLPADGAGILLFDELNAAAIEVMAALYQVMLDFAVGDHQLGDGWVPFAAGNRMTDRGVAHKMPTPLSDRLFHYDMIVEWEPWCEWAEENDIHPLVIAYLKFSLRDHGAGLTENSDEIKAKLAELVQQPLVSLGAVKTLFDTLSRDHSDDDAVGMLHRFNPKSGDRSFPTPRSWEFVSDGIKALEDEGLTGTRIEEAMIAGKVGPAAAKELIAYAITFRQNFTIDGVISDPTNMVIPNEPSMRCAVAAALARQVSKDNIGPIGIYVERLPEEYQVMFAKAATKRAPKLNEHKWITRFNVRTHEITA